MVICMVGSPLSGKSTLGRSIAKEVGISYMSTGEYARKIGMDHSEKSIMDNDVSAQFNDKIVQEVFKQIDIHQNIIIDGFPRSVEQAVTLADSIEHYVVIYLFADPAMIIKRAQNRQRPGDEVELVRSRLEASIRLRHDLEPIVNPWVYTVTGFEADDTKVLTSFIKDIVGALGGKK